MVLSAKFLKLQGKHGLRRGGQAPGLLTNDVILPRDFSLEKRNTAVYI